MRLASKAPMLAPGPVCSSDDEVCPARRRPLDTRMTPVLATQSKREFPLSADPVWNEICLLSIRVCGCSGPGCVHRVPSCEWQSVPTPRPVAFSHLTSPWYWYSEMAFAPAHAPPMSTLTPLDFSPSMPVHIDTATARTQIRWGSRHRPSRKLPTTMEADAKRWGRLRDPVDMHRHQDSKPGASKAGKG